MAKAPQTLDICQRHTIRKVGRPAIPTALRRQVLVEAGHRCAIPTCGSTTTEIAHIIPWSKAKEHTFDNLIALCPTCHSRFDKDEIEQQAMIVYKRNLGLISGRYGEAERRLLDWFVRNPDTNLIELERSFRFEFMYLLEDGLLLDATPNGGVLIMGVKQGPSIYMLSPDGTKFVEHLRRGQSLELTPETDAT